MYIDYLKNSQTALNKALSILLGVHVDELEPILSEIESRLEDKLCPTLMDCRRAANAAEYSQYSAETVMLAIELFQSAEKIQQAIDYETHRTAAI